MNVNDIWSYEHELVTPLEYEVRGTILDYLRMIEKIEPRPKNLKDILGWLEKRDDTFYSLYEWMIKFYPHPDLVKYWEKNYGDKS